MARFPASRVGDMHICPVTDGPKPHVGGPISPPGFSNVRIGGLPAARGADLAVCTGPPDIIVTGAAKVLICFQPAARVTSKTLHGGMVTLGLPTVLFGGASGGAILGWPGPAKSNCHQLAAGRHTGVQQQSAGNCGVEAARQLVNTSTGRNTSEEAMLDDAIEEGLSNKGSPNYKKNDPSTWTNETGGTSPRTRQKILERNGVASELQDQNMDNIAQSVGQGKGVITSHDAGHLWGDPQYIGGGHAVVVTGIKYNADGEPERVFYDDTGRPNACGSSAGAGQFEHSLRPNRKINVTQNAVPWKGKP